MKKIASTFLIFLLIGFAADAYAQKDRPIFRHRADWVWNKHRHGYPSIGVSVNAMNYFGDITPYPGFYSTDIKFTRANFSIFAMKRYGKNFTARAMFSYGRLKAADSLSADPQSNHDQFRYIRNLSFQNDIYELSFSGIFDLGGHREVFYDRPNKVIPYLVAGVAVLYHNPETITPKDFGAEWISLQPLGTEGQGREGFADKYSRVQVAFPIGFGFRKRIGQRWDLSFEVAARYLLTDYLDDVSKNYVDLGVFGDDDLTRALSDRSREDGRVLPTPYVPSDYTYIGVDGRQYTTYVGFGNDYFPDNIRGNQKDNDVYTVTGIHLAYILPGQVRCPVSFRTRGKMAKKGLNSFFGLRGAAR